MYELVKIFYIGLPGAYVLLLLSLFIPNIRVGQEDGVVFLVVSLLIGYLLSYLTSFFSKWPKDEILLRIYSDSFEAKKKYLLFSDFTAALHRKNRDLWFKGEERLSWHFASVNELWANLFFASLISALILAIDLRNICITDIEIYLLIASLFSFTAYYYFQDKEYRTLTSYLLDK